MKSYEYNLPATDFFQRTISSLLELCTHRIDGHCIISIEGRLLLTLDTGDKVALDILQHDVDNVSKPVNDDDTSKSSSTLMVPAAVPVVDKSLECNIPPGAEIRLAVHDDVQLESLSNIDDDLRDILASAAETEELFSSTADCESMALSAVLQPDGKFVCSSCGKKMRSARAIERHISQHRMAQSLGSVKTDDRTCDIRALAGVERLSATQGDILASIVEADLHSSYVDDNENVDEHSIAEAENTPNAVLQPNGEFMCSSCGEVMKGARDITRHISEHVCLQSSTASATPSRETTDKTYSIGTEMSAGVGVDSMSNTQATATNLDGSFVAVDGHSTHDVELESMPSAVLQPNGEYVCSRCGEIMNSVRDITRHISKHMSSLSLGTSVAPSLEAVEKAYDIKSKDQATGYNWLSRTENSSESGRRYHKPVSKVGGGSKSRSFPCRDCKSIFASSTLLNWHHAQMHKSHQCQKCGTVLRGRRNFCQHVRTEHPGLPTGKAQKFFMCEYCSQSFGGLAPLKDHISTNHLGTVEHRCDQCGKLLCSVTALRLHQRQIHQDDYKRTCDGCGRQFSRTASLLDHITCMHPHLLPEKYRSRLDALVCKRCNITFARRTSLQRHIEVKHGGAPKYMCSVCSRRFGCRKYVLKHFRAHHPDISASKRCVIVVNVENEKASV